MPISNQAKKRMRSDKKKHSSNQRILSKLNTLKKANRKIEKREEAEKHAKILYKEFDKAASKGVIPKGRASRNKARVAKRVASLSK